MLSSGKVVVKGSPRAAAAPAEGPTAAGGGGGRGGPLLMSEPTDPLYLTSLICLVRRQLEFFVATEQDEANRKAKGGVKKPIVPGRAGIRCVHCRHLPVEERAKNFSSFPTNVRLVNQAVRNYQRYHLPHCQAIPPEVVAEYELCKKNSRVIPKGPPTATGRKISHMEYWEECCYARGLVDNGENGIKFASLGEVRVPRLLTGSADSGGRRSGSSTAGVHVGVHVEAGAAAATAASGASAQQAQAQAQLTAAAATTTTGGAPAQQARDAGTQAKGQLGDNFGLAFDALLVGDNMLVQGGGSSWELNPLPPPPNESVGGNSAHPPANVANGIADGLKTASPLRERMSVKDWINSEMILAMTLHGSQVQDADRSYQLKAATLALALLETVNLYHQNNIAFGNSVINPNEILITPNEELSNDAGNAYSGKRYSILFSGYVSQSLPSSATFAGNSRTDLTNIGVVLYEMFSGIPPFQTQDQGTALFDSLMQVNNDDDPDWGQSNKKTRGKATKITSAGREYIPLRDLGLPVAIDALVVGLMNADQDIPSGRYKSAGDVIVDVQQMISDPDRYLFDIEDDDTVGDRYQWAKNGYRLVFSNSKLYGRDADTALLMSVFDRTICKGGPVEAVAVSGYSGIGKTSLICQLRQPTIARRGFFISGKFDTLRQATPLSAIANALDEFCDDLVSRQNTDVGTFIAIRNSIQDAIGYDSEAIVRLIPNLRKIVPLQQSTPKSNNDGKIEIDAKALNRFIFLFRKFFHAIASPSHPVLLFIDDLQWADTTSLDLIQSIVCESDAHSFLFVGSYRSNEVNQDHPLLSHLGQIRTAGVPLLGIELSNMNRDSVNALISDTLKLSPLLTRPLADAVYSKTSGNCLFVVELLSDLHRRGLLRYSVSSRRWEWDDEAIAALDIQANVVDLMRRKLLRLGATEMWSVKVVACLGAETKKSTLDLLSFGLGLTPENGLVALLRRPVEEGLLMKVGSSYRFSHDQIQQAAYSLVTVGDRPSFHLQLGRCLLKSFTATLDGVDGDVLFTCVDQLNRGSSKISDRITKVLVAQLNLQAGKKSIASSAFLAASIYLRFALCYLDESDWENNYSLCLEVYSSLSETEYVTGKYEEMTLVLNEVFARARTFDDKLRAYYTLASATAAQSDFKAAISTCFEVLRQLGEPFEEKEVDRATAMQEVTHTKSMLENKDAEWFMSQNLMTDRRALNSMKCMNMLLLYLYYNNVLKLPLVISRMVQLTIRHGMCKVSAMAFSSHGLVCCGFLDDYAEGYRVGKIAAAITERLGAQELVARINVVLYGCINVWTEPLQSTLPPLMAGHDAGVSSGDPEYALAAFQISTMSAFQCGRPLNEIVKKMAELDKECKQYRMEMMTATVLPMWQCMLNLIGDLGQEDPTVLEGGIIQGDSFLHMQIERKIKASVCQYYLVRLLLAYTFGKYELAAEMYDKCMEAELDKNLMTRFTVSVFALYGGLTALAMARIDPENSKWNEIANSSISKMETWASSSAWNFEHKLCFLRAEKVANDGDRQGATALYERAVKLAREHGFVNEEAVICERCAEFLRLTGDEDSAKYQYDKAYDAYMKWGALRKCEDLKASYM